MLNHVGVLDGILILLLTVVFVQILKKFSVRLGLVDIPNHRSSHVNPTPRGAGIAMFLGYGLIFSFFHFSFVLGHVGFFIALLMVFLLGLYDDVRDAAPRMKLLVIAAGAAAIFFIDGMEIQSLGYWFGVEITLPYLLSFLVTVFAVVGFTNALNLVDGLDGLAGSLSLVILVSFFYIGYVYHDQFLVTVSFFVMLSLLGFLFFNWYPASIFMGDSGSLVLGFIISVLAIRATHYVSDTTVLFLAAVPIIDTIIVMTRRMQRGQSPFSPDKNHFHHKILMLKGSVDASVHILVSLQIILSVIGLLLRDKSDIINLMIFSIILFVFFQALDDRREQRNLLVVSRVKKVVTIFVRKLAQGHTLLISSLLLGIVLMLKILM